MVCIAAGVLSYVAILSGIKTACVDYKKNVFNVLFIIIIIIILFVL